MVIADEQRQRQAAKIAQTLYSAADCEPPAQQSSANTSCPSTFSYIHMSAFLLRESMVRIVVQQ